jgi:hypothetical protein
MEYLSLLYSLLSVISDLMAAILTNSDVSMNLIQIFANDKVRLRKTS